ncbi:MAG: hypothetical protein U1F76_22045 [Candidatus Competibacteraceae bacterium]
MHTEQTYISATISPETKRLVEHYLQAQGITKGALVEAALLHHLQALKELPADIIIPPRLRVSRDAGEALLARLEQPLEPTEAMKALFRSETIGCIGVVVDAKPEAVDFYRRYGFEGMDVVQGLLGDRSQPLPMFLPLAAIPRP